jgi:site-specific recombinase XerD
MKMTDVNFQAGKIFIQEGKGRKDRIIPMGRRMSNKSINTALQKRAYRIFPDLKILAHQLRHSFATHILEAGAGIKQVKDILGHSCIESTVIYTHFNSVSMRKILKMYHPRENELYEEFDEEAYFHIRK